VPESSGNSPGKLGFDALNAALKAAGEETRLRVLALLSEAELTVSDLTDILRQSQPRISRHLKLLTEAGLVERFREGTWAFFRLAEAGGGAAVTHALLDRLDPGGIDDRFDLRLGRPADRARCRLRHLAERRHRGQRLELDLEPQPEPVLRGPDGRHRGTGIASEHGRARLGFEQITL